MSADAADSLSPSWAHRVRAGRRLASSADVPVAAEALGRLLLDASDTAVSRQTAAALVRAGTPAAVRVLALAVAEADDAQGDWILTGVHDALADSNHVPAFAALCRGLARDTEAAVRRGAAELLTWTDTQGTFTAPAV